MVVGGVVPEVHPDCACLGCAHWLKHGNGEYVVWVVIFISALWVVIEATLGSGLYLLKTIVPSLICIPLTAELGLRLIYEPGYTHRDADLDRVECWPLDALCGTWAGETTLVVAELAFCRSPLAALDIVAIVVFLLEHWVLVILVNATHRSYIHAFSSSLQLLRLLRPWAVSVREKGAFHCGGILLPIALWLTKEKNSAHVGSATESQLLGNDACSYGLPATTTVQCQQAPGRIENLHKMV